jgi:hypothetical protein
MGRLVARAPLPADSAAIAIRLRECDLDDIYAAFESTDVEAMVRYSFGVSDLAWTILLDGEPVGAFGVVPSADPAIGAPWMLVSPDVERAPLEFARKGRGFVQRMRQSYGTLVNFESAARKAHLRWLRALGFQIGAEPERFGMAGAPFYRFWL